MNTKKWSFPVLKAARWGTPVLDEAGGPTEETFEDWMLWVKASDLPLDLPLDPNARYPKISGRVPEAITRTLTEAPAEFVKRNTGLCMVARACHVKENMATLQLNVIDEDEEREQGRRGDGVLNGGHTYAVIKAGLERFQKGDLDSGFNPGDAVIRVEVQTGVDEGDLPDISRARNVGVPVEEYSLKNLGKVWEPIKKILPKEIRQRVKFMEGDPEAIPDAEYDVGDLVKLLALFNNKAYPVGKRDPISAYTSEKSLIAKWNSQDFEHLLPHLMEFIYLHDEVTLLYPQVMAKAGKVNGIIAYTKGPRLILLGGKSSQYYIPPPFTFPVLAALRAFLSEDGSRWYVPPEKLVKDENYVKLLISECWEEYKKSGRSSATFFGRDRQMWKVLSLTMMLKRQAA